MASRCGAREAGRLGLGWRAGRAGTGRAGVGRAGRGWAGRAGLGCCSCGGTGGNVGKMSEKLETFWSKERARRKGAGALVVWALGITAWSTRMGLGAMNAVKNKKGGLGKKRVVLGKKHFLSEKANFVGQNKLHHFMISTDFFRVLQVDIFFRDQRSALEIIVKHEVRAFARHKLFNELIYQNRTASQIRRVRSRYC